MGIRWFGDDTFLQMTLSGGRCTLRWRVPINERDYAIPSRAVRIQ
jgi:hypothetical protein